MSLALQTNAIRANLERALGTRLRGIVLFGSEARAEATSASDIDLLVVLASPISPGRDLERIIEAIYPVQLEIDRPLHAVPVAEEDFDAGNSSFLRNAASEGIWL